MALFLLVLVQSTVQYKLSFLMTSQFFQKSSSQDGKLTFSGWGYYFPRYPFIVFRWTPTNSSKESPIWSEYTRLQKNEQKRLPDPSVETTHLVVTLNLLISYRLYKHNILIQFETLCTRGIFLIELSIVLKNNLISFAVTCTTKKDQWCCCCCCCCCSCCCCIMSSIG